LRPILLMAAAFVPAIVGSVDPTKLPPPEIVTKHLSPIVSSQRYDRDGYMAESIGPITLDQSAIGLAILSSLGAGTRPKAGAAATGPFPGRPRRSRHSARRPCLSGVRIPVVAGVLPAGFWNAADRATATEKAPAAPFRHYSLLWRKAEENCCSL